MRKTELDSLRGLAAFAVLVWHATASSLHTFLAASTGGEVHGFVQNALTYSPLRIFSAGPEAVWIFFLLSGFVLVRSAARPGYDWSAYYPSRMIRLYLPVAGAVLVTAIVFLAFPRVITSSTAAFVGGLPTSYTPDAIARDLTLLDGTSIANVPLWSLQWEVLFSILLPLYVFLARRFPWWSLGGGILAIIASVWVDSLVLLYMPIFLLGAVLGLYWEAIRARLEFLSHISVSSVVTGVAALVTAVVLITSDYTVGHGPGGVGVTPLVATGITLAKLAGMALLLALALSWTPLQRTLRWKPFVALGLVSFSLYLTHGPIVIGLVFLMGPGIGTTIAQVTVSLAVSVLFYFLVEKRAHLLSRRIAQGIKLGVRSAEPSERGVGPANEVEREPRRD